MRNEVGRGFYVVLLGLHPRGFRNSFGKDMLQVFDEAAATYGLVWLLSDAVQSLVRQRMLRWPQKEALSVSPECFGLMAGMYPMLRPPHLTMGKLSSAFMLSLLLYSLIRPF